MNDIESFAHYLSGYLQCLRRLSGNRCDFWCYTIALEGEPRESFEAHIASHAIETSILSASPVGYRELESLLHEHLFTKLTTEDRDLCSLFSFDIVEHIEMSYRDSEPKTNPLSSGAAVCFTANSAFHGSHIYIVIPVRERALAIGLGTRA